MMQEFQASAPWQPTQLGRSEVWEGEVWEGGDVGIPMADPCWWVEETNTTL